jgi:hypothetical protein
MFRESDPGCGKTRLRKIALSGRWIRPNMDHAEHSISALPYPGRRDFLFAVVGELQMNTSE